MHVWEGTSEQIYNIMCLAKFIIAEYRVPTVQAAYRGAQTGLQKSLLCGRQPQKICKV